MQPGAFFNSEADLGQFLLHGGDRGFERGILAINEMFVLHGFFRGVSSLMLCDNCLMIELEILLADTGDFEPDWLGAQPLSASSRARLAQIAVSQRRMQFLLGRWLMAQAAGVLPIDIAEDDHYPRIASRTDWHASISHSGPYVAVIASQGSRCGLDIEHPTRQRDWVALAERAFSAIETDWISAASPEQQAERFYRIWTLREAAFKAGTLASVVGHEPVFDPIRDQALSNLHWQHWQTEGLYVSAVSATPFQATLRKINPPPP